jgi:hypothetical protein
MSKCKYPGPAATARTMGAMQTADDTDSERPGIGHAIQALGGIQSKPPVSASSGPGGGGVGSGGAGTGFTWNTPTESPMYQGSPGVGAMTPAPEPISATWQGGPKPMTNGPGDQPGKQPPENSGVDQPEVPSESLENAPRSGFRQKATGRE